MKYIEFENKSKEDTIAMLKYKIKIRNIWKKVDILKENIKQYKEK